MPGAPPRAPKPQPGQKPPLHQLLLALTEFFRVATEALEEVIDEYREDRKRDKP